ncbi:MAG: hypothetical protein L3K07_05790 [Thermoplasmata archaeon]|nr:hypothetical protein [Thermoplasmata archaeon]
MPGAPNKPPETAAAAAPVVADSTAVLVRRLVPSRIALRLDTWRRPLSAELLTPYANAEAALARGELEIASGYLDQLAIRFAEPRWPTLPEPFLVLRVKVIRPQPPHWDPDHALSPEEKESRKVRREGEAQLKLARGALEAEGRKGTKIDDLAADLAAAEAALAAGPAGAFWSPLDRLWATLRERVPIPNAGARTAAPNPATEAGDAPA